MKNKSRSRKALINTVMGFINEIVTLICGLVLPRLILSSFGSAYNGLISSVTQFISVIALMKAGIGGVTRASLYKPLADNNNADISAIINQTESFFRKIAIVFIGFILAFAAIYPIFINKEFDFVFSFTLILIIGLSTFAQYYFGLTYQMLLNADQLQYIPLLFSTIAIVLDTLISVILIKNNCSIHVIKLGSSIIHIIIPMVLCKYTKLKYNINPRIKSKTDLIGQRWDAVGHEIANFINSNTDIVVLSVFTDLACVSIYTIYHYVIVALNKIVTNLITGFGAAFGNMYARNEIELMHSNLSLYELIVFSFASILYSVAFVLITPFVAVYTRGITDANYYQPLFGYIIILAGAFSCFRIPYQTIVTAIGHYKQTRKGAFIEASINIMASIILVIKFGLVGVAIGTLVAAIFRTFQYAIYLSKNVLKRSFSHFLQHILISLLIGMLTFVVSKLFLVEIYDFYEWILMGILITAVAIVLTMFFNLIFYLEDMKRLIKKINNSTRRLKDA